MSVATAIRQSATVDAHGKLELTMPPTWAGTQVEVIVLAEPQPNVDADLPWQLYPLADGLTALMVRDGAWHIAYCPEVPGANGQGADHLSVLIGYNLRIQIVGGVKMQSRTHKLRNRQFAALRAKLAGELSRFHPELRKTLLNNLSELIAAVTLAKSVQLAAIAEEVPVATAETSREQWVRRQLQNQTVATLTLFQPLAAAVLQGFANKRLYLLLDPTDLANDLTLVMVAIAYRGRAVPLAWLTVYIKPETVKEAVQLLFAQLHAWLPATARVHLIADREFRGQEMLALIQAYGWTPVVRLKGDTRVTLPDASSCLVRDLAPAVGHTAFYPRVWLTAQAWGPYSLSLSTAPPTKPDKKPDPWYIVSTEPATPHILTLYAKRMWVDEMFRDFKGLGYHLEQTHLEHPIRIDRLVLVVVLAYLWALGRGLWVERLHLRYRVDRDRHPQCSLFTVGFRWIHHLWNLAIIPDVCLIPVF